MNIDHNQQPGHKKKVCTEHDHSQGQGAGSLFDDTHDLVDNSESIYLDRLASGGRLAKSIDLDIDLNMTELKQYIAPD